MFSNLNHTKCVLKVLENHGYSTFFSQCFLTLLLISSSWEIGKICSAVPTLGLFYLLIQLFNKKLPTQGTVLDSWRYTKWTLGAHTCKELGHCHFHPHNIKNAEKKLKLITFLGQVHQHHRRNSHLEI